MYIYIHIYSHIYFYYINQLLSAIKRFIPSGNVYKEFIYQGKGKKTLIVK